MSNQRGGMGRMGRGRMSGEKAKDFSGSMKKLLNYMKRYKFRFLLMMVFAVASTVFSIWGPNDPRRRHHRDFQRPGGEGKRNRKY